MDPLARLNDLAVSDRGFLFDPYSGATFTVNATGLAILRAVRDGEAWAAIVAGVCDAFALDDDTDVERDLDDFLHELRRHGLVPKDFSPGAAS